MTKAKAEFGLGYGRLSDDYYQRSDISFAESKFDKSWYDLFRASVRIESNSLNAKQYPTGGRQHFLTAQYVTGKEGILNRTITAGIGQNMPHAL